MNKSQEQMINMLDYLKESDIPCEVTLECFNFPDPPVKINIDFSLHPDKLMMSVFKKTIDSYQMRIKVGDWVTVIKKYSIKYNQWKIENIKSYIVTNYGEYITNNKRKTILDDIFNDPNPKPLT